MSGSPDTFPVSNESTGSLRRGSSEARASNRMSKSSSAILLQDATKFSVPPSVRTKQSAFRSRIASKSSMTKNVSGFLATKSDMNVVAEERVISKQSPGPKCPNVTGHGIFEGEKDFLSKPININEEIKRLEDGRFSCQVEDTPLHDLRMECTCSETVGIWLENSQLNPGNLTEVADIPALGCDEEQCTKDQPLTSYSSCMTNEDKFWSACEDGNGEQSEGKPPSDRIVMTSQPVTATQDDTQSTGRRFGMLYFKISVGVLAVLLGCATRVFSLLRPTFWEFYEPPPT